MKGGICTKHGTEMKGFGMLVFCSECDAEAAMIELMGEKTSEELSRIQYGYIVSPTKYNNKVCLHSHEAIRMKKPNLENVNGFVYRLDLNSIKYTITADGKFAYADGTHIGVELERVE